MKYMKSIPRIEALNKEKLEWLNKSWAILLMQRLLNLS